eukprot:403340697
MEALADKDIDHIEEVEDSDEDDHVNNEKLQCRFYRKDFPEENDLVVAQITKTHENGAYVILLEYENLEGLILSTEVTNKRVRQINKFLKMGKKETMMVLRVDKDKRYIDLSKKKVLATDAFKTEKFYKKAKMVHNILKQVATKLDCYLLELYEAFGWDLYDKYDHAYDAFRLIMNEPEQVFSQIKLSEEQRQALVEAISRKMAPSPVKVRADYDLNCFTTEGIDAIKHALLTAKAAVSDENIQVAFKLIAPPHYKCECITLDKVGGIAKLELALEIIEREIKAKNGTFKLVNKPQVIGAKDDKDIIEIMDKINEDEEGSEGEEDNDEGMGDLDIEDEDDDGEERKEGKKAKKTKKSSDNEEESDDA